eukprot:3951555-Amphidinium_carterae.1
MGKVQLFGAKKTFPTFSGRNPDDASWLVSEWDDSSMLCDSDHKKPMRAFQAGVQGSPSNASQ